MATKEERKEFCKQYGYTKEDVKEAFASLCDNTTDEQFTERVSEGIYTWKDVPASMLHELMEQSYNCFDNANAFARQLVTAFVGQNVPEFIPNNKQSGFAPQNSKEPSDGTDDCRHMGYSVAEIADTFKEFVSDATTTLQNLRFKELIERGYSWNDMSESALAHLMKIYHSPFDVDISETNSIVEECLNDAPEFLSFYNLKPLSESHASPDKDNEESFNDDKIAQKFFSKFLSGEPFSEEEIENILMSYTIAEKRRKWQRWSQPITSIVSLCGHTFQIDWRNGLTEEQDNEYPNQPFEVTSYTHIEMVTVTDWTPVVPKPMDPKHMPPVSEEDNEEEAEERD